MITYAIVVSNSRDIPPSNQSRALNPKDKNYKYAMLARMLNRCHLHGGDAVRQKGTQKMGAVIDIIGDADKVVWKNNIPYFVRVKWDGEEHTTLCPYKLLKKVS